MNGIPNHIHLLIDLHPSVALADLVKDIKQFSNKWIKDNKEKFPMFDKWGEGYYAVSIGITDLENCKNYIIGQKSHHFGQEFLAEMEWMALTSGLTWYADDWN